MVTIQKTVLKYGQPQFGSIIRNDNIYHFELNCDICQQPQKTNFKFKKLYNERNIKYENKIKKLQIKSETLNYLQFFKIITLNTNYV